MPLKEYPFWWDTAPSLRDGTLHSELSTLTYDVAIVGAGYTGLAAARILAKAGASVVVLDREWIGWGASSRNGGQVLTGMRVDPETLVARYGEQRARDLFATSLQSIAEMEALIESESIECEFVRAGHVKAASKPAHFDALRREQALLARAFGHRVELVAASAQRRELGSDAYFGLLVDEHSAAVNPARYVAGLAAAARRAGAKLQNGTCAVGVTPNGRRWSVSIAAQGPSHPLEVDAGDVLMATDAYTNGVAPALRRRYVPVGSYIIATEPLSRQLADELIPRRRMVFDTKRVLHYFRLAGDRRLLFGGRAEFTQPGPSTTARASAILRRDLSAVFPQLANTPVEFAWGGTVAFTRDQLPHAGRLETGIYYAGGYGGHGIAMATSLGEIIGRRMAGELIEHPLMDDSFAAIPLYNGNPWFLPIVGAYYRFLDYVH